MYNLFTRFSEKLIINMNKKIIISVLIIIILLCGSTFYFMDESASYKFQYIQEKSISDINLEDNLIFTSGRVGGNLTGFVAFNDRDKQPKGIKQYYMIDTMDLQGENIIYLKSMVATDYEPPILLEQLLLTIVEDSNSVIKFVDENGFSYSYDKKTKKMKMYDGEHSYLISNNKDYKNYVREVFGLDESNY